MRITAFQKQLICENTIKYFGQDAHVWLFGSRFNDLAKGGDIDLYIEPSIQNVAMLIAAKLQFMVELHKKLGEQKNDVVLHRENAGFTITYLSNS